MAAAFSDEACRAAVAGFDANEVHFEGLSVAAALKQLRNRGSADPIDAVDDPLGRSLLAQALMGESEPVSSEQVTAALETLRHRYLERRQRQLRAAIAEAERKGDATSIVSLTAEKLSIDRALREM